MCVSYFCICKKVNLNDKFKEPQIYTNAPSTIPNVNLNRDNQVNNFVTKKYNNCHHKSFSILQKTMFCFIIITGKQGKLRLEFECKTRFPLGGIHADTNQIARVSTANRFVSLETHRVIKDLIELLFSHLFTLNCW